MRRGLPAALAGCALLALSCVGAPKPKPGTVLGGGQVAVSAAQSLRGRIEGLIALGSPSSLEEAVTLAGGNATLPADDAASYAWVAYEMARLIYPEIMSARTPVAGSPPETSLVRAFVDARNGRPGPSSGGSGYLYELFPAIAVFRLKTPAVNGAALSSAERFSTYGQPSAVVALAKAIALERTGDKGGALAAYGAALDLAADCYPAALGKARLLGDSGQAQLALDTLALVIPSVRETPAYRKAYAAALYAAQRWSEALPLVTAVLMDDPLDSRFLLMRAHLLVERGEYRQAAPLLDAYASVDANDRLYLYLRARVALESTKDRSAALAALRRGLERYPDDLTLVLYAAEVLWAGDAKERAEAVVLAARALKAEPRSERALRLLLAADIASGNTSGAAERADAILAAMPAYSDYGALFKAYRSAGRLDDAARMAKAWLAKEPASEQANLAWLGVMVDRNEKAAAIDLINRLLAAKGTAQYRSALYVQQARLQPNDDLALASLRSALVENGMNIDALVATYDIYFRKNDLQRARFYLKQALSLAPDRQDLAERRGAMAQLGIAIP